MSGSHTTDKIHFVASGALRNNNFAPQPKTFWELQLHGEALWNHLQQVTDRHLNPILHPKDSQRESDTNIFDESLLRKSFSEFMDLDSTRRNIKKLPQHIQEFVSSMQSRDYPTLLQPDGVCGAGASDEREQPLLLLAIKTTELNFKNRQAIRQTWGQSGWVTGWKTNSSGGAEGGGYVRRVFLLGKEDPEGLGVDVSKLLQLESRRYRDILQWDFRDTFFNLTLKDVFFWSWFAQSCGQIHFVLKGDDDVFVNTPKLVTYLQEQLNVTGSNNTKMDFMVGHVISAAQPNRVTKSKYFIPDTFYKGLYPAYAGGGGVVYSGQLTKRLHHMSKRVHLFPIDDVFVGMCMVHLKAYPMHHPAFLTFDFPGQEEQEPCSYHRILVVHKRSPEQLVKLWANMNETQRQCGHVPLWPRDKRENTSKH